MAKKRPAKRRRKTVKTDKEEILLIEKRCKLVGTEEAAEEATTSTDTERVVVDALLVTKKLVILQGPHGCGKTHTANLVAHQRNVPINVLQINEQYDSKVLYGSYSCSEVPGEFIWQPSKFAQFLQRHCVILLENLDHGGADLAAAIVDLAERGHAALANGRHIRMHTECRILGTISCDEHQTMQAANAWRDYPYIVKMAPIPLPRMDTILATMAKGNNALANIRAKLLQTFVAVSAMIRDRKPSMDRALNAKDLFRAFRRLVIVVNKNNDSIGGTQLVEDDIVSDRCALFAQLFDAWVAHLSSAELRCSVAAVIGEALSLSPEQQHHHMDVRFPEVAILEATNGDTSNNSGSVQFGRMVLERRTEGQQVQQQHQNGADGGELSDGPSGDGGAVPFVLTRDAAQLLERVGACVSRSPPEPVLLTGDTGVGKTATVQHMARLLRVPLHVVNLSQESEFSDLVGGHKPTSVTNILRPMVDEYISLFRETFDAEKNAKFIDNLNNCFNAYRFADLVQLVVKSSTRALRKFAAASMSADDDTRPVRWTHMLQRARRLAKCFRHGGGDDDVAWKRRLLFAHVKGVLTEAAERGDWLLVDEINLAPAECMDALVELLDPSSGFTVHADFRLFACMNSANDVGKRQLPRGIRSAFTEFFVDETRLADQLRLIIRGQIASMGEQLVEAVLQFYMDMRAQFPGKFNLRTLSRALAIAGDQLQQKHFGTNAPRHCLSRACAVTFVSQLDAEQRKRMQLAVTKWLGAVPSLSGRNVKLGADEMRKFLLIEGHKILRGNDQPMPIITDCTDDDDSIMGTATDAGGDQQPYIFTPSVRANMALLASVVATGRFPILMEGETSAGKTSMVMQLAKMSGNRCFRINNHEHTDIQEYIGSYAPDSSGRLEFVEGVLLRAVRNGDWIILDELNLAPSAVLEALNRLLDDNRELFVAELNIAVRAHPRFRLFATQNPVGSYAGRKRLSRAFLSRFMCLQWDALPHAELPQIVQKRCGVSPRMAELMAAVLAELKVRRAIGGIFACSDGLMTLRDLFRWGHRMSSALADGQATHDWRQALADQGYFVLGTRCRTKQDEQVVVEVLQRLLGRQIDIALLFSSESPYMPTLPGDKQSSAIVLTARMRRMLILCAEAWRRNEPVLLVGETGCGKTTAVYQFGVHDLLSINCHERTDAADLLGSIRPVTSTEDGAGGGFRWRDGIVLQAMRRGQRLLIDEISLAPDSVLERLNSLLEPQRAILLTDAGAAQNTAGGETVTAADGFQLVATMNPGNDHGKKELSKALRNRFTEVWCSAEHDHIDLVAIVRHRLLQQVVVNDAAATQFPVDKVAQLLIKFADFFNSNFNHLLRFSLSTRDLVTLCELFVRFYCTVGIPLPSALHHAIEANVLDALGVLPARLTFDRQAVINSCIEQLRTLMVEFELWVDKNDGDDAENGAADDANFAILGVQQQQLELNADVLSIGPFHIKCNQDPVSKEQCRRQLPAGFSLNAPATRRNALRVARALASSKPVMLEGSPGAGKSSLVVALAAATGHKLVRLNLSEQTDLHDLFGGDVPVTGQDGSASFTWRDGPVLKAIKEGFWILLDEMNLASQSVLEGLNSCFDFRKHIYIAELDRTFTLDSSRCKFFACQNPHQQGGARRALPKSFLNRFISIFVEEMTDDDFIYILCEFCKTFSQQTAAEQLFTEDRLAKMVLVNKLCRERVHHLHHHAGSFEFNLRDLFRWVEAIEKFGGNFAFGFELIYLSRLTTQEAREKIIVEVYNPVFGDEDKNDDSSTNKWVPSLPILHLTDCAPKFDGQNKLHLNIGCVPFHLCRGTQAKTNDNNLSAVVPSSASSPPVQLLATQLGLLERVAACVTANWLVLLVGPPHVGKRSTVRALATLVGQPMEHIRLTTETDALELLGSYEQVQNKQGQQTDADETSATTGMDAQQQQEEEEEATAAGGSKNSNLRFEWVDSVFVRAFRDGQWLLVEDVNCCSSAVLDCLNSCLESSDGELVLPVQQQQQQDDNGTELEYKIRRHPNFRIFFTMNPKNGQLSRAMRNRVVELAFGMDPDPAVEPPSWHANVVDVVSAIAMPSCRTTMALACAPTPIHHSPVLWSSSSPKQSQLVAQFQRLLQDPIQCSTLLCCAAQLPSPCSAGAEGDNTNIYWVEGGEQSFVAGLEQFMQLTVQQQHRNSHVVNDAFVVQPELLTMANSAEHHHRRLLGFGTFPPVARPIASALSACQDELTLYYWHCWSDVSAVNHLHPQHPDVCLQLAFLFPGSFDSQKHMWPTALRTGLFASIKALRQKELFLLMSRNKNILSAGADQSVDMDHHLFDRTFPAEMRCWPDPRKLAVNASEIGQQYLAALHSSPVQCRPFLSVVELEQYKQRWLLNNKKCGSNEESPDDSSTFGFLGRHFAEIIRFLNRIFCNENSTTVTLPWRDCNDDDGGGGSIIERVFEFGLVGSTDISQHLCSNNNDRSQYLLFSHLQLPFITFGLNTLLWSHLQFDNLNIQRHLRLVELTNAAAQLEHAYLAIWELCFARKNVHNATKNLFHKVAAQFGYDANDDDDIHHLPEHQQHHVGGFNPSAMSSMVAQLLDALRSLVPPQGIMDPPLFAHLQQMHWRESLQKLNCYLDALQMFIQLTNAKSYAIDQIVAICCSPFSSSFSAPIVRQICASHRYTVNALRQLSEIPAYSKRPGVPESGTDPSLHFRREFVERLRSASAHLTKTVAAVTNDAFSLFRTTTVNDGDSRLRGVQLNLHNVLCTISTLKALLTTTIATEADTMPTANSATETHSPSSTSTLFIYPDLVAPYLHVLNLLSIVLSELHRQIGITLTIQHIDQKYGFSRVEFDAFIQLLNCCCLSRNESIGTDVAVALGVEDVNERRSAVTATLHAAQPFIRWLITTDQQRCPLTAHQRLPICLWSIAAFRGGRHYQSVPSLRRDVLAWILHLWECWHEQNARIQTEEQLTVVKRKRNRKLISEEAEEEHVNGDDDANERVQMEPEEKKLRSTYLPDFSKATYDAEPVDDKNNQADDNHIQQPGHCDADKLSVSRDVLHDALCCLFKTLPSEEHDENNVFLLDQDGVADGLAPPPFLTLLNVADKLELYSTPGALNDETMTFPHLLVLDKLREQLKLDDLSSTTTRKFPAAQTSSPSSAVVPPPLNVYRDSEPSALVHCVQCLAPLQYRVQQLLAEFPENAQLATLSSSIDAFVRKAPAGAPLMKHAAQLEHILVRAEEWESIADRAHSIRTHMLQLQDMLVDWRRREVHCWAGMVNSMRADRAQLAVLAGWPLFKCAMDTLQNEEQQRAVANDKNNTLILAFVDWMHSATVGDFEARLWTGKLLTKWLQTLSSASSAPNSAATILCRRMRCTCAHFAQFGQAVQAHFAVRFAPVERSLHGFCRAVRYTDLNVWSVRDSAKRAHVQLIRILLAFKRLNDEPIFPLLFDKPSVLLEWTNVITLVSSELDELSKVPPPESHCAQTTTAALSLRSIPSFVTRLEASVVRMLGGMDALDALRTDAVALLNELQTNIIYDDENSGPAGGDVAQQQSNNSNKHGHGGVQSINEKRHGRALFTRQQQFSRLVRAAASVGLNARRAQHINSEQLTRQTIAETDALHCLPETIGTHFRHSTAARNVFLRQFAAFRRQNSAREQQLTPATLQQLRSIVEYALHWMHNALGALGRQQHFGDAQQRTMHITRCIGLEAQNAATIDVNDATSFLSHARMSAVFVRNGKLINTLCTTIDRMRQLHRICPTTTPQLDDQQQQSMPSSMGDDASPVLRTPLGTLRQPSTEHAELGAELGLLEQLLARVQKSHSDALIESVRLPQLRDTNDGTELANNKNDTHKQHLHIWKRTNWRTYTACLQQMHSTFTDFCLPALGTYFADELTKLGPIFDQLLLIAYDDDEQQQPSSTAAEQQKDNLDGVERAVLLYLQSVYKEIEQYNNNSDMGIDGDDDVGRVDGSTTTGVTAPPLLDTVKHVLEFVNKLNSDKVLSQLYGWFITNSTVFHAIPMAATDASSCCNRLARAYTVAHGLCSALCHLHNRIGTFVAQLASFHAHWTAIGCHLLTNGFVNPIPVMDQRHNGDAESEGKRMETGDGFGDADLAPNATDVSSQVENMEQIEGLKENDGNDQQQQQMDEIDNADQQQQQKMPEVDQPIDVEDDFAGCLEGLDMGEEGVDGEEDIDEQHQRENAEDGADWNFGEVEEPEETQLDPQLWEQPPGEQPQQDKVEEGKNNTPEAVMDDGQTAAAAAADQLNELDEHQQQPAAGDAEEGNDSNDWTAAAKESVAAGDQQGRDKGDDDDDNDMGNGDAAAQGGEEDEHYQDEVRDDAMVEGGAEDQPNDLKDDFAGCLEGLDMDEDGGDGEEDIDEQHQRENAEECADNVGEVEEQPEETQLEPPGEQPQQDKAEEDKNKTPEAKMDDGQIAAAAAADQQQQQNELGEQQQQPAAGDAEEGNNDWTAAAGDMDDGDASAQENAKDGHHQDEARDGAVVEAGADPTIGEKKLDEEKGPAATSEERLQQLADDNTQFAIEVGASEQQRQLSAHASATLEQALRTRALFSAHLRRLRQEQGQQQMAELATDEPTKHRSNGEEDIDEQHQLGNAEDRAVGEDEETQLDPQLWEQPPGEQPQQGKAEEYENYTPEAKMDDGQIAVAVDQQQQLNELDEQHQRRLQLKWALITDNVAPLAAELAESLRAIIEPTIASRLEGDYRTGKRLNMRRLIPYIASDYRKDRIWMRRTRKERRNYQICIAVDNSQSMQHNYMTEITCNALCLIERALRQLEVGQLALCSFGSQVQLIADFAASEYDDIGTVVGDAPPPPLGVRILQQLRFDQSRTDLGQLLDIAQALFTRAREREAVASAEQLLIILGDGRGVFSEGAQRIRQAISRLSTDHVTVLFLVMDVPPPSSSTTTAANNSNPNISIMDMRIADFSADGQCTFRSYMSQFPFPLYALVRDTRTLPATVAEAVRQWFEHTATG